MPDPIASASSAHIPASSEAAYDTYCAILKDHLSNRQAVIPALSDIHAPVWQQIAKFLSEATDQAITFIVNRVFNDFHNSFPNLPQSATRRPSSKNFPRLRRKLDTVMKAQKERSACCDFIACRVQTTIHHFNTVKEDFTRVLGDDVDVAWRNDSPTLAHPQPDIVTFGYAFRVGGNAVMEIQIVEPVAAWVFEMNSLAKHGGGTVACVTFKESKLLYEALKDAILRGLSKQEVPDAANVAAYYHRVRAEGLPLDYDELAKFQVLVDQVFSRCPR